MKGLPESALIAIFVVVLVLASFIVVLAVIFRHRGEIRRWQRRVVRRPRLSIQSLGRQKGLTLEEITQYCPLFEYYGQDKKIKPCFEDDELPEDSWWKEEAEKKGRDAAVTNLDSQGEEVLTSSIPQQEATSSEVRASGYRTNENWKMALSERNGSCYFREPICAICLEEMDPPCLVRILRCQHGFHAQCVTHWLLSANRCPLCNVVCFQREQKSETVTNNAVEQMGSSSEQTSMEAIHVM
ncbi:hypothetical protein Gasu2_51600 [Galdieria sulphuraria]|uniref:Zinc finger (C3HC4-type RING finger) family protein n=1 Tax=Galdieria sulphuraria TaxID=130081 RepID=M2XAS3_GALSU|nr:zinc finger (C3HC4-type RING finger) family protein [Galdieria sulphuraria]EME26987.1 zinc finger (C3HC4-type RING finger) family protein [Galdieria sulphuraria]GJD11002.1 hypothetical protein Gasu2_51600 [Galdieria sulphuraria]|eukprot:XP_005703507.1 zinc finger (C3HC4-type RING finger) family protein [Galdieria sulphuraria]